MPRTPRVDIADNVYHIINRSNARVQIFDNTKDYRLYEEVLTEEKEKTIITSYPLYLYRVFFQCLLKKFNLDFLSNLCYDSVLPF